jgi:hypothetical protein
LAKYNMEMSLSSCNPRNSWNIYYMAPISAEYSCYRVTRSW